MVTFNFMEIRLEQIKINYTSLNTLLKEHNAQIIIKYIYLCLALQKDRLHKTVTELTEEANPEVKVAYGEDRLIRLLERSFRGTRLPNQTMDPVIDVLDDAVTLKNPPTRTLVDGSDRLVDIDCVSI